VLRIHDGRLLAAKCEEIGIEQFHAAEVGGAGDIVSVGQLFCRFSRRQELLARERADGFHAARKIAPELLDRIGARHAKSHANNGNVGHRGFLLTHGNSKVSRIKRGS
jgi:hypothetical protein